MLFGSILLLGLSVTGVAANYAPYEDEIDNEVFVRGEIEHELYERQNNFRTQYWANENANLSWTSGPGGSYRVSWNQRSGGNSVVGKGYSPGAVT
jgi:hypothetical protein